MSQSGCHFDLPPRVDREDGGTRGIGFELEFSGIGLDDTAAALRSALGAELQSETAAERVLQVESLGEFRVELDWEYLKHKAAEEGHSATQEQWLERLSDAAALLVPVEVVCPPVAVTDMAVLDPMVKALRAAGAVGTEESLLAAYGVHVNAELPALDAAAVYPVVRAFCLLQWWLVDRHAIDATRKLSPYIGLYPAAYVERVLSTARAGMDEIIEGYLEHNATRNRALDLLPLLAEIDEAGVRAAVDDPRVKARPTWHFRLPDCHIEREDWSLAEAWNAWCLVEKLAHCPAELEELAEAFLAADRPLLGVDRGRWVARLDQWLEDRGLA